MKQNQAIDVARSGQPGDEPDNEHFVSRDREATTKTLWVAVPVLIVTTAYAIIRYSILGTIAWQHVPIFVFNKGVSWAALAMICLSLSMGGLSRIAPGCFKSNLWLRKYFGLAGVALASLHILMSFFILDPVYFPLFYLEDSGRMTGLAELTMLMGAVSWVLLLTLGVASLPTVIDNMSRHYWLRWQHLAGFWAGVLGGLHVFYGYAGWIQPDTWSGGLPPITLLSALTVVAMLIVRAIGRTQ